MIRFGTHADIPAIIKIGQLIIDASQTYSMPVDKDKASYMLRRAISDRQMALFVAERAGKVVGFFIGLMDEHWFSKERYATDVGFCVLPEHADQGVWLLRRFMRWAKGAGVSSIQLGLSTGMDADGRTGQMYQAHGLSKVGGIFASTSKEVPADERN
jgi:GNAT superfamily N-acetyltransferase